MTLQKNFSHNLTAFYRRHAKTLTAFSEELGISRSSLQEIMKGNSNSRLDTASHFHAIIDILMRPKGKGTK